MLTCLSCPVFASTPDHTCSCCACAWRGSVHHQCQQAIQSALHSSHTVQDKTCCRWHIRFCVRACGSSNQLQIRPSKYSVHYSYACQQQHNTVLLGCTTHIIEVEPELAKSTSLGTKASMQFGRTIHAFVFNSSHLDAEFRNNHQCGFALFLCCYRLLQRNTLMSIIEYSTTFSFYALI